MGGAQGDRDLGPVGVLRLKALQIELGREAPGGGQGEVGEAAARGRGEQRGVEAALLADEGGQQGRLNPADPTLSDDGLPVGEGVEQPPQPGGLEPPGGRGPARGPATPRPSRWSARYPPRGRAAGRR